MKRYLIDTNLLLLFLRNDERWEKLNNQFDFGASRNYISAVSVGELESLALQNNWGIKRMERLKDLTTVFAVIDINIDTIIKQYAQIDAFSQGKLKDRPLSISARNMGKNDLWIAATAAAFQLELLTSDLDFDHLNNQFLTLHSIDIQNLI